VKELWELGTRLYQIAEFQVWSKDFLTRLLLKLLAEDHIQLLAQRMERLLLGVMHQKELLG
jgi:hypothetical protein